MKKRIAFIALLLLCALTCLFTLTACNDTANENTGENTSTDVTDTNTSKDTDTDTGKNTDTDTGKNTDTDTGKNTDTGTSEDTKTDTGNEDNNQDDEKITSGLEYEKIEENRSSYAHSSNVRIAHGMWSRKRSGRRREFQRSKGRKRGNRKV